ncbi:hypothetical protein MKQ70_16995 [Chitinophaga sedimenti]|uniref:hypothetical protein n=1 Tax=Chitinophaga sedimenti TaxID=2033606 RepID=UPI00200645FD|nr:hypothetical protein [Chitinophaga sedimenti]MCK7556623.1 hypothetical protein [Chitinophaga sedimenti]
MEDARLQYLVAQWQSNRLTAAEQQEITAFMADPGNREQFVSLLDKAAIEEGTVPAFDEAAWMPVIQNVLQSDKVVQHTLYPERRRSLRWLAAAAVAALLISAGAFYFINQKTDKKVTADAGLRAQDVAPGQDVAILTLADGTTVQLDSTGRQTIQQGQTTVNQQNGQLQYSAGAGGGDVTYNTLTVPRGGQFRYYCPMAPKYGLMRLPR